MLEKATMQKTAQINNQECTELHTSGTLQLDTKGDLNKWRMTKKVWSSYSADVYSPQMNLKCCQNPKYGARAMSQQVMPSCCQT